jgi:hypothetical protein
LGEVDTNRSENYGEIFLEKLPVCGAEITSPKSREESSFEGHLFHPAAWTADLK